MDDIQWLPLVCGTPHTFSRCFSPATLPITNSLDLDTDPDIAAHAHRHPGILHSDSSLKPNLGFALSDIKLFSHSYFHSCRDKWWSKRNLHFDLFKTLDFLRQEADSLKNSLCLSTCSVQSYFFSNLLLIIVRILCSTACERTTWGLSPV